MDCDALAARFIVDEIWLRALPARLRLRPGPIRNVPDLEAELIAGIDYLRHFPGSLASFAVRVIVEIRATNAQFV